MADKQLIIGHMRPLKKTLTIQINNDCIGVISIIVVHITSE